MKISLLIFSLGLLLTCLNVAGGKKHRLVVYWGQNAVSNKYYPPKVYEDSLMHFCQKSKYDTIIVAFCYSFFDSRNKDSFPSLDFSYHCNTTVGTKYPFLLKCLNFSDAITQCQKNRKKVLISLGGAAGIYGFTNSTEPETFAYRVWNLFLGGSLMKPLRPFGSAILDGVDLDIEGGTLTGYGHFVRALRRYMAKDSSKSYFITAAPQCPFPDTFLGPGGTKALQVVPADFDEIHVQFYNNYCTTGSPAHFWPSLKQWLNYSITVKGPKILIGLPSSKGGASRSNIDYRTPNELKEIYDVVKNESQFGGFMLWEASFDQNNVIDGRVYSDYVADILAGRCPGVPAPLPTNTPNTNRPATTISPLDYNCLKPGVNYFPDPTNCRRFYHCSNGRAYLRWCSHNLYWNQKKLTCDWPNNVQCNVFYDDIENEIFENL